MKLNNKSDAELRKLFKKALKEKDAVAMGHINYHISIRTRQKTIGHKADYRKVMHYE